LTEKVKQELAASAALYNVQTSLDMGRPEVDVVVDRARAGMLNVSIDQISQQLRDMLMGRDAGQWESGGELKDIVLKLDEVGVNQIGEVTIKTGEQDIRVDEVAHIDISHAPKEILRRNQARIGKITANIRSEKPFDHVVQQIEETLDNIPFPPQYRAQITGEEQSRRDSFDNLKFALILSLILVYMVLASQFESLIHPLTIILTIPLAGVGAILIFFLLGQSLNIMAFIGIIMLAGIAVNDSIILVDAINQLRREGVGRLEAIVEAGQRRIRPILMTSLTTILALLPLTIGFGEGAALRAPMALAVIGGLVTSTILTLVVIPCVYWQFDRIVRRD